MLRAKFIIVTVLLLLALAAEAQQKAVMDIRRPTIIAFFPHISQAELDRDTDTNEALGDFQLYLREAKDPLSKLGIELKEVYAGKFDIRVAGKTTTVLAKKPIGYYLVDPGRKSKFVFGVMTNTDLVEAARKFFEDSTP